MVLDRHTTKPKVRGMGKKDMQKKSCSGRFRREIENGAAEWSEYIWKNEQHGLIQTNPMAGQFPLSCMTSEGTATLRGDLYCASFRLVILETWILLHLFSLLSCVFWEVRIEYRMRSWKQGPMWLIILRITVSPQNNGNNFLSVFPISEWKEVEPTEDVTIMKIWTQGMCHTFHNICCAF